MSSYQRTKGSVKASRRDPDPCRYYTIDAVQAKAVVDDLAPRVVIPMHYRSDHFGYPVIGRLEEFTGLCRNVVEYDSNTLVLTAETRPQTAVLKLK